MSELFCVAKLNIAKLASYQKILWCPKRDLSLLSDMELTSHKSCRLLLQEPKTSYTVWMGPWVQIWIMWYPAIPLRFRWLIKNTHEVAVDDVTLYLEAKRSHNAYPPDMVLRQGYQILFRYDDHSWGLKFSTLATYRSARVQLMPVAAK